MTELSNKINNLKNNREKIKKKKWEFIDGGTVGNSKTTYKEFISKKLGALNEAKKEKRYL